MFVEPTVRESLISYISDAYKDAYGYRPRGVYDFDAMSEADLESLARELSDAVLDSINEEKAAEERCRKNFEKSVSCAMAHGAPDRASAVRWLLDAENLGEEYSTGYAQFVLGVGYDYDLMTGTVDTSRAYMGS